MTKDEVIKLLVLIESVYSPCVTKDETVMNWFNFCAEMNYEQVMEKLMEHIRKSPYPPTMANLSVFKDERNEGPAPLEKWVEGRTERMAQEPRSGKRNPIPVWMREYSTRRFAGS